MEKAQASELAGCGRAYPPRPAGLLAGFAGWAGRWVHRWWLTIPTEKEREREGCGGSIAQIKRLPLRCGCSAVQRRRGGGGREATGAAEARAYSRGKRLQRTDWLCFGVWLVGSCDCVGRGMLAVVGLGSRIGRAARWVVAEGVVTVTWGWVVVMGWLLRKRGGVAVRFAQCRAPPDGTAPVRKASLGLWLPEASWQILDTGYWILCEAAHPPF